MEKIQKIQKFIKMKTDKLARFKGLHLFFLSNFPEATFIQGATSIPDFRVRKHIH